MVICYTTRMVTEDIEKLLQKQVAALTKEKLSVRLTKPSLPTHGDYTTTVALPLAKILKKSPIEVAEILALELKTNKEKLTMVERIEVVAPGFINFWLSQEELLTALNKQNTEKTKHAPSASLKEKRILIEYAHPNTHKEMHIGHMRTMITGEALARLLTVGGATVFRANYQGDIGPHVAKALYGIEKIMVERKLTIDEIEQWDNAKKAHFLGEGYVQGNKDYEEAKTAIDALNTKLYQKDKSIMPLYEQTRKWSLDYYEDFYARFYTTFDRLFFESEMADRGKEIVTEAIGTVFTEDNGAVIFPGEKYGLHTRVFITQVGNPTYEGKEMANAFAEYKAFPFDLKMHVVGSEQAGYFKVVFKALELLDPEKFEGKQHHVSMGMVTLTDRKMSSRTGEILRVDWLIDQVKERILKLAQEGKIEAENKDAVVEMVAIGAVKYSVLKVATTQNVAFDIEKSVALDGDSGPYLQYTYARTQSVLRKAGSAAGTLDTSNLTLNEEEKALLRMLYTFPQVVSDAASTFSPHILCTFLFDLTKQFNLFYQKHAILKSEQETFRLVLTGAVGNTIKQGLNLLGIKAPEKM